MTKVLVAEDEQDSRDLLVGALAEAGYAVIEAEDGAMAFEKACQERPDLILLDLMMPVMDGFEVLRRLRGLEGEDSLAAAIPVILLTAMSPEEGEQTAFRLGAQHYITKPWEPDLLELAVKVTLRESEAEDAPDPGSAASNPSGAGLPIEETATAAGRHLSTTPIGRHLSTTRYRGSLTLIEGASSSGKSVLSQHFSHQALQDGHSVAYFSSEHTANTLTAQMASLAMDVSDFLRKGKLLVRPVGEPTFGEGQEGLLASLAEEIASLPDRYETVVIDGITDLASYGGGMAIAAFCIACRRLCDDGRSVFLVVHPNAVDPCVMARLQVISDTHLSLRTERIRDKLWRIMEVLKVRNAEMSYSNLVTFEIVPDLGMQVAPFHKVKA